MGGSMRGMGRGFSMRVFAVACCAMLLVTLPHEDREDSRGTGEPILSAILPPKDLFKSMPADYFIENVGQLSNKDVRFYTTSGEMQIGFAESAVLIKIMERPDAPLAKSPLDREFIRSAPPEQLPTQGVLLRLDFEGANRVAPRGMDLMPLPTNFFIGNEPSQWRTGVRSFREVAYKDLYNGIDLVYHVGPDGLKYDFFVHPKADPAIIRMMYEGVDSLEANAQSLVLQTAAGEVRDGNLMASAGNGPVRCEFTHIGMRSAGFACEDWNHSDTLVIDPLLWATFLGGSDFDEAYKTVLDDSGNPVVVGYTTSADFPATPGAYDLTYNGGRDVSVAKLSADGSSLLWATYLGGSDDRDEAFDLAFDASGDILMTGLTSSADFPATPGAYDFTYNGGRDAFVANLSADGSSLNWASFLGGSDFEEGGSLAIDALGNPVVLGGTYSADFPVTSSAYDIVHNGTDDAFVAKLSADGSTLLWATFLGGSDSEWAHDILLDDSGNPGVVGNTMSSDFPATSGAYDVIYDGGWDAFMARLSADGSSLRWATFLGGVLDEGILVVALDPSDNPVIAGETYSVDFPVTPGAYDVTQNGRRDAFVAKLSADGSSLRWSTFLGGSDVDSASALDANGGIVVAGGTMSPDFPATPGAYDVTHNGDWDAFVAWLSPDGSSLYWATYLGGGNLDFADGLVLDASGNPVVAGEAESTDFPVTPGSYDVTHSGARDAFVAKLRLPRAPTIDITAPSGGEVWTQGSSRTVASTAFDFEDAPSSLLVWINYTSSAGGGGICGPIAGSVGSCSWTLPTIAATDVVVNGTVIDTAGLKGWDQSGPFTIRAPPPPNTPPSVAIISPVGGEEWFKGSSHTINWTMHDDQDDNADLTVYVNYTTGGATSQLAVALKGELLFTWILPSIEADDVVVNITVIDAGGLKDCSQSGPFTIKAPPSQQPDFLSQYWWLLVIIVAVVIVPMLLLLLLKRKKPKEEKEEVPPSEQQKPPPSD